MGPVVWGNVAAWVGSVLTGASLLLGFGILRRGRAKDERAQAAKVAVWTEHRTAKRSASGTPYMTVHIVNHSDGLIQGLFVAWQTYVRDDSSADRHSGIRGQLTGSDVELVSQALGPGQE